MGNIIEWPGGAARPAKSRAGATGEPGQILFFTGVRYERFEPEETARTPARSNPQGRRKRRRA